MDLDASIAFLKHLDKMVYTYVSEEVKNNDSKKLECLLYIKENHLDYEESQHIPDSLDVYEVEHVINLIKIYPELIGFVVTKYNHKDKAEILMRIYEYRYYKDIQYEIPRYDCYEYVKKSQLSKKNKRLWAIYIYRLDKIYRYEYINDLSVILTFFYWFKYVNKLKSNNDLYKFYKSPIFDPNLIRLIFYLATF